MVKNLRQEQIGGYQELTRRAGRLALKVNQQLAALNLVANVAPLVPQIAEEMDTLQKLTVSPEKTKDEQKKQAGFIQQ